MTLRMGHTRFYVIAMIVILSVAFGIFYSGYWLGNARGDLVSTDGRIPSWRGEIAQQRKAVANMRLKYEAKIEQLSKHLGQLKAHVIRLNALGSRLTSMANIDKSEFNFDAIPAAGGPIRKSAAKDPQNQSFLKEIDELNRILTDRENKLNALETLLLHTNLQKQVHPEGRPVHKGWISSPFGTRRHPITGRRRHHDGIDFAAPGGTPIYTVAAGVVTSSGRRAGYGNLVEINHGNGLITRYAHNRQNLVKVGQKVRKGQMIARVGSTGHSTGNHVHFEVIRDGRTVNPKEYINTILKNTMLFGESKDAGKDSGSAKKSSPNSTQAKK